jgi:ubiquinone/menaquinone biosynthesis C-methylase UbiE
MTVNDDIWSEWLKKRRFSGDEASRAFALNEYKKLAVQIVDKAQIFESATVLDIGAGDGLVGLTALSKLGADGKLILSDISEAALAIPKEIFNQKEIPDPRIEFLITGAENLSPLPSASVDRVVIRSVLLYVNNKQSAFNEIFRVLKPGGIAAILEPINQRQTEFGIGLFRGYRLDREPLVSVQNLLQKVIDESKRQLNQTQGSLLGYSEHDLVHLAIGAGFEDIELEYSLNRNSKALYPSPEFLFDTAPNPHAKTLHELMNSVLTPDEFIELENVLKKVILQPSIRTTCLALLVLKKNITFSQVSYSGVQASA